MRWLFVVNHNEMQNKVIGLAFMYRFIGCVRSVQFHALFIYVHLFV